MVRILQEELVQLDEDLEAAIEETDKAVIREQRAAMEKEIETLKQGVPEEYQSIWHPSRTLADFEGLYHAWGYSSEMDGVPVYHIILESNGDEDNPLNAVVTDTMTNYWGDEYPDEILKLFVELSAGGKFDTYGTDFSFLPYQHLREEPVQDFTVGGFVLTVQTETVQRFAFSYNHLTDYWNLSGVANKVGMEIDITASLLRQGKQEQKTQKLSDQWMFGDFYKTERYSASNISGKPLSNNIYRLYLKSVLDEDFFLQTPIFAPENLHQMYY